MFGIGTTELVVILVVALIVVGPKQLPKIARTLGKAMGEFKRVSTDLHRTINTEVEMQERKDREKEEKTKLSENDSKKDKDATPAEKSEEDVKAEKSYQSAVEANTPVEKDQPEKAADEASEQAMAEVEDGPVLDVQATEKKTPPTDDPEARGESASTPSSAAGDKA